MPSTLHSPTLDRKATPAGNPVHSCLYKVLGTSFDDESTKQALSTLSELYANPKAQVQDDDESATVDDIATRARKYLRKDLELKLAEGSRQFLVAFGQVDQVGSRC